MNSPIASVIAGRPQQATGTPIEELFEGVDDLIRRVAQVENPEIRKTRARVHAALVAAKSSLTDGSNQLRHRAAQWTHRANGGDADPAACDGNGAYPGGALGLALLVGLGLGLIVSPRQ